VRDRYDDFKQLDAAILVVSFSPPSSLMDYRQHLELPFEVSSDVDRAAYRAYNLLSASRFRVWSPRVIWRYLQLVVGKEKMTLKRPKRDDDLLQLGGDFVIDRRGAVIFSHQSEGPEDRPEVSALLDALKGAGR